MQSQEDFKDMAQLLLQDPPIIVGGGGSAYVWIKKGMATQLTDEEIEDLDEDVPKPGAPLNYTVYRVDADVSLAVVSKGDNKPPKVHGDMNPKYHSSVFQ